MSGPDRIASQDGTDDYCYLGGTDGGFATGTRAQTTQSVRIVIDPATSASPKVRVYAGATPPITPTLTVDLPEKFKTTPTFKFGFSGSTGGRNNIFEVLDLDSFGLTMTGVTKANGVPVGTPAVVLKSQNGGIVIR